MGLRESNRPVRAPEPGLLPAGLLPPLEAPPTRPSTYADGVVVAASRYGGVAGCSQTIQRRAGRARSSAQGPGDLQHEPKLR